MTTELPEDDIEEITQYRGREFNNLYYYENQFYRKYKRGFKLIPEHIENRRSRHIRTTDASGKQCLIYYRDFEFKRNDSDDSSDESDSEVYLL